MPLKASTSSSCIAKPAPKAAQRLTQPKFAPKFAPKRPKTNGTSSSPYIIDSDEGDVLRVPVTRTKHTKLADVVQPLIQPDPAESSDDEPLINRVMARKSVQRRAAVTSLGAPSRRASGAQDIVHPVPTAAPSALCARFSKPVRPYHEGRHGSPSHVTSTPSLFSPFSQTSFPLYGQQTNLTPAFQSISNAQASSASLNSFASDSTVHRRVPSPDRLFTNMTLKSVNKLILSMPKIEREEARRRSKARAKAKRGSAKKSGAKKQMFKEVEEIEADVDMAEDDGIDQIDVDAGAGVAEAGGDLDDGGFNSTDVHAGDDIQGEEYASDGTLAADSENEYAASPAAAKKMRLVEQHPQHSLHTPASATKPLAPLQAQVPSQSRIGRTARLTPATEVFDSTDIIDLTNDEPTARPLTPQGKRSTGVATPSSGAHLADQPSLKSLSHLSAKNPRTTTDREAAFLRAFTTKWWPDGIAFRDALIEVNAALHPLTMRFSDAEGTLRLRSLSEKGKLAIHHDLVYHMDQDPGVDASPPPLPPKRVEEKVLSPVQQLKKDLDEAETKPYRSPYGKISEARYGVFENRLFSAVVMQESLFRIKKCKGNGKEEREDETLWRVVEGVNEWMGEHDKFGVGEVCAALVYLKGLGRVELEDEKVRLIRID